MKIELQMREMQGMNKKQRTFSLRFDALLNVDMAQCEKLMMKFIF